MSITRFVSPVTKTLMDPFVPAGTIAAFATMSPASELRVDTSGLACPVGHTVRYPSGPLGTTVTFNAYAFAPDGMPHELPGTGKSRVDPAAIIGGPNAPLMFCPERVSANRHGVTGTNLSAVAPEGIESLGAKY